MNLERQQISVIMYFKGECVSLTLLFSASVKGAKARANLYSLIETAKANGLEPYTYLKRVFTELPNAQSYEDVEKLLPNRVKGGVA